MKRFCCLLVLFLWACPQPPEQAQSPAPKENVCAQDNGGCGDPMIFRCEDTGEPISLCHYDFSEDWKILTENVAVIDHGESWPSTIVVHGPTAFPIVSFSESKRAFIAAARVGEGKVMHWGHETYFHSLQENTDDSDQLLLNAIGWMTDKPAPIIGVGAQMTALANFLSEHGYPVVDIAVANIASVDIYIREAYEDLSPEEDQALQTFVQDGKGLITAGLAWWWSYENKNAADNFPGNQMIGGSGITIAGDWGETGAHPVSSTPPPRIAHARFALEELLRHQNEEESLSQEDLSTAVDTAAHAVAHLSLGFEVYFEQAALFLETVDFLPITPEAPLLPAEEPLRVLSTRIESKFAQEQILEGLDVHAAAQAFPGALPGDAVMQDHTFTINASYAGRSADYLYSGALEPRWESTGYYAAPGTTVEVILPENALGHGIDILVGSHTDQLWAKESIERFPQITRTFDPENTVTKVGNAFGGLVYLRIPAETDVGYITASFSGGYLAPAYIHGETDIADWQNTIRNAPGPWAELISEKFILTFPSILAQTLDDPDTIMNFWDSVLDADADLEGSSHERVRPERFVLDQQISVGWMHSGYPLMAFTIANEEFIDLTYIFENSIWGPFHELGHNHQSSRWLLPGTTETTCNLWSTYVTETILEMSIEENETLAAPAREERITTYLAGGPDFYADWNVWVALDTYLQLKEYFGWEFYKTIFPLYRNLSENELSYTDQGRIDLWVIKSSGVAGKDLSDFYLAWGFPISQSALDAVAHLPDWSDHPMLDYN